MTGGTWRLNTAIDLTASFLRPNATTTTTLSASPAQVQDLTFGTGSGSVSIVCALTRGLAAGASETHDLFDGSVPDVYGDAAEFRLLRGYAFWVASGGDSSGVTIAGGASNPHTLFFTGTTPGQTAYPSGPAAAGGSPAGVAVTSTARMLKVTNNGAVTARYTLLLAGTAGVTGAGMGVLGLTYA